MGTKCPPPSGTGLKKGHHGMFDFICLVSSVFVTDSKNQFVCFRPRLLELFQCSAEGWEQLLLVTFFDSPAGIGASLRTDGQTTDGWTNRRGG